MTDENVTEVMHPILGTSDAYSSTINGIYNYLCYYPPEPEPPEPLYHTFILLTGYNGM